MNMAALTVARAVLMVAPAVMASIATAEAVVMPTGVLNAEHVLLTAAHVVILEIPEAHATLTGALMAAVAMRTDVQTTARVLRTVALKI
jgi:hypothetical protein